MEKREIRSIEQNVSVNEESRHIEGTALVFNSLSQDLGGFREQISPNALDGVLERSDVLALLNHDRNQGILAISIHGKGDLKLEKTERGLSYSFDAPETPCGEKLLEELRSGNISASSFAFNVIKDSWEKTDDGYIRTIEQIGDLFDVSPVNSPAYLATDCALRSLEEFRSLEEREEPKPEEKEEEKPVEEEPKNEDNEEPEQVEEKEEPEQVEDEEKEDKEDKEERNINKTKHNIMNNFSLIKAINDVVNNRSFDESAEMVFKAGIEEMRKSGLSYAGQIQLPVEDRTFVQADAIQATVEDNGKETVATDKLHILEPLRANSVLAAAGATYLTGLVGNVSIPTYSGSTCGWKGEISPADKGNGEFDSVEFAPKRLTAYIDISKQFLNQDSVGAEEMLKNDIVNALKDKLEETILGNEEGSNTKPAGIFNGATATTITYANLVAMEQALEEGNVSGDFKFIVSPAIKSAMKTTTISGELSDLRMILEGGEANGYPVLSTSNAKGIAFGKWSEYVVAQWGAIDLTIDPYTQAANGCIRIVINAYFDAKPRRSSAIVAKTKQA